MLEKMLIAVYEEPYKVSLRYTEVPVPCEGEALIKIKYAGICGSDMLIYYGKHPRGTPGVAMCHEFIGEVVSLGSGEDFGIQVGEQVAVEPLIACGNCKPCSAGNYNVCETLGLYGIDRHGGMAEYAAIPIKNLHSIPENVDLKQAALLEPLAVAVHVVGRSHVRLGSSVLVLGGGPIGFLIAMVCRAAGASFVAVSEVDAFRLAKLEEAGITAIDPAREDLKKVVNEKTKGEGVNILFEVAGAEQTLKQATSITNVRGQIVIVALLDKPVLFDLVAVNFKEYEIIGSRTYTAKDFTTAISLLAQEKIFIAPLVSHVFPLKEAGRAFELAATGRDMMKILIES